MRNHDNMLKVIHQIEENEARRSVANTGSHVNVGMKLRRPIKSDSSSEKPYIMLCLLSFVEMGVPSRPGKRINCPAPLFSKSNRTYSAVV